MKVRYFSLLLGGSLTVAGLLSLLPSWLEAPAFIPNYPVDAGLMSGLGDFLGLFPTNLYSSALHVILGLAGIACYFNGAASKLFAGSVAVLFGSLGLMGLLPAVNTALGIMPLYGADIPFHLGMAAIATYFGFIQTETLVFNRPDSPELPGNNPVIARLEEAGMLD